MEGVRTMLNGMFPQSINGELVRSLELLAPRMRGAGADRHTARFPWLRYTSKIKHNMDADRRAKK